MKEKHEYAMIKVCVCVREKKEKKVIKRFGGTNVRKKIEKKKRKKKEKAI